MAFKLYRFVKILYWCGKILIPVLHGHTCQLNFGRVIYMNTTWSYFNTGFLKESYTHSYLIPDFRSYRSSKFHPDMPRPGNTSTATPTKAGMPPKINKKANKSSLLGEKSDNANYWELCKCEPFLNNNSIWRLCGQLCSWTI